MLSIFRPQSCFAQYITLVVKFGKFLRLWLPFSQLIWFGWIIIWFLFCFRCHNNISHKKLLGRSVSLNNALMDYSDAHYFYLFLQEYHLQACLFNLFTTGLLLGTIILLTATTCMVTSFVVTNAPSRSYCNFHVQELP